MRTIGIMLASTGFALAQAEPSHFAEILPNGDVVRVIVAEQVFIDAGRVGAADRWVQTVPSGGVRKNYPGPGYNYNRGRDAFVPPKPYPSWQLGADSRWAPPVARPNDGNFYVWDENPPRWVQTPGLP